MLEEKLREIFEDGADFKNIPLTIEKKKKIFKTPTEETCDIPFMFLVDDGLYVFIENKDDAVEVFNKLTMKTTLRWGIYVFGVADDDNNGFFYDEKNKTFVEFDDFYENLLTFRINHRIPESLRYQYKFEKTEDYFEDVYTPDEEDEDRYVRPVIAEKTMDTVINKILELEDGPRISGNYYYYPDGAVRVKKEYGKMLKSRDGLFECDEEDPNRFFWIMLLGGWFGLHKYKEGKYIQGILYSLTMGLFGFCYALDILALLTGTYFRTEVSYEREHRTITRNKTKIYYAQVQKRYYHYILPVVTTVAVYLLCSYVFFPAIVSLLASLTETITNTVVNNDVISDINDVFDTGIIID